VGTTDTEGRILSAKGRRGRRRKENVSEKRSLIIKKSEGNLQYIGIDPTIKLPHLYPCRSLNPDLIHKIKRESIFGHFFPCIYLPEEKRETNTYSQRSKEEREHCDPWMQ
jgi:hypothetical protein